MQEAMKEHRTDDKHLLVVSCPGARVQLVADWLRQNGCEVNDATPEEDEGAVPCHAGAHTPGTCLRGYRYRDDLTQVELARLAGIPRRHISDMEHGRRPIGRHNAKKLAAVFNTDPRMFLL